jgi:hypothetical protein
MLTYIGRRGIMDDRESARRYRLAAGQGYAAERRDPGIHTRMAAT